MSEVTSVVAQSFLYCNQVSAFEFELESVGSSRCHVMSWMQVPPAVRLVIRLAVL